MFLYDLIEIFLGTDLIEHGKKFLFDDGEILLIGYQIYEKNTELRNENLTKKDGIRLKNDFRIFLYFL
jgi:hypothetical protein